VLTVDESASMRAIAEEAGFSRLTLYRHFPTREALIEVMTDEMLDGMADAVDAALERPGTGADAIAALLHDLARITSEYPSILGPQPGRPSEAVLQFREGFAQLVERGKADGSIRPDADGIALRQVAMGGLSTLMHCAADGEPVQADFATTVARLLLDGARPR